MNVSTVQDNMGTVAYLNHLTQTQFWGSVALKFEAGRIVHIRREENLKPTELSGIPRSGYESESRTKN